MRVIEIGKYKKIVKIMLAFVLVVNILALVMSKTFAMQHYYDLDYQTGMVTATMLNVRSGPSTDHEVITTVRKNEYVRIFAGIGNWYIVQIEGDYIGAVSQKYIKPIYPNANNSGSNTNSNTSKNNSSLTKDEQEVLNLINQQRAQNGLSALKVDAEVQRVAKIKAQDMVDSNYFSQH